MHARPKPPFPYIDIPLILEKVGDFPWRVLVTAGDMVYLLVNALGSFRDLRGQRGRVLRGTIIQQMYFTALQSVGLICVIGFSLGVLTVLPLFGLGMSDVHSQAMAMRVVLFHQLVPLLTALVIIGRSGTAITAELGDMRQRGVIDNLLTMGVEPHGFIVFPRLLALTFSLLLLTLWGNLAAMAGAGAYNLFRGGDVGGFVLACVTNLPIADMLLTTLMVVCWGVTIVLVHAHLGLRARNSVETQRLLPKAFVHSLLGCVALTVIFAFARQ